MKSGLFWKLLGAQIAVIATVLLIALGLLRLHAADSFRSYLQANEAEQLLAFRDEVLQQLEQTGSWAAMLALRNEQLRSQRPTRGPGLPPRDFGAPRGDGPHDAAGRRGGPPPRHRPPGGRRGAGGSHQPLLLDLHERVVFPLSAPPAPSDSERLPVQWQGQLLGHAVMPRRAPQQQAAEQAFEMQQNRAYRWAAVLALAAAAVFAALLAAWLARRIQRIERGTRAFADRNFSVRVADTGSDEISRLAHEVNRMGDALASHERRQKQWLADVAHELRTPLAVLRGELEALLEGVRSAGPDALHSLQEEVARLNRLVEDLNLLSLAESGGLRLHLAEGDLRDLIDEVQERFDSVLSAAGFSLQVQLPDHAAVAHFDQQRLEQVLGNLISNCLRYAQPGPASLILEPDAQVHRIVLRDSGPGVEAQRRQQLFDRFYQVDGARSRPQRGSSGLGLAICRSIVEAHRGHIWAEDADGGLAIVIELPVRGASHPDE